MPTISELKKQSGAKYFVSFFGKTSVPVTAPDYQLMKKIAAYVVEHGSGVIHGGYTGGMMEAVSLGAQEVIAQKGLSQHYDIGVLHALHDLTHGQRTLNSVFTDAMPDTFDRLRAVVSGDVNIVCSIGGDGTELEASYVFSENTFAEKPTPLIFVQTETGTQWSEIIDTKIRVLSHDQKSRADFPWLYFAHSFEKCIHILNSLLFR
ncbi:MAG: hypothetical protein KIH62_000445 [Candidatus Kerfeldbacteria bacterium]|nr:hypothetical protein [Candidatus Kerfeldbacteria bacterium]